MRTGRPKAHLVRHLLALQGFARYMSSSCPFCKTDIPGGASVCAGCGARKGTRSDTIHPLGSLMRIGVWCNTLGLVIAVTCMGIVMPWKNDKILNGVTYECVQYLTSSNYSSPRENVDLHYNKYSVLIDKMACEDIPDIEAKKKKIFDEELSRYKPRWNKKPPSPPIVLNKSSTIENVNFKGPTIFGIIKAAFFSISSFFIGFLVYRIGSKVWIAIFGELSDPMWIR